MYLFNTHTEKKFFFSLKETKKQKTKGKFHQFPLLPLSLKPWSLPFCLSTYPLFLSMKSPVQASLQVTALSHSSLRFSCVKCAHTHYKLASFSLVNLVFARSIPTGRRGTTVCSSAGPHAYPS